MTAISGLSSRPASISDALVGFDFAKLIASAAQLRPDRPALCDSALPDGLRLTFAQLDRAIQHSAALWRDLALPQDARVLIVAGARVAPVVAAFGALRTGLDVVLAPSHLLASEVADLAQTTGAVALCGETANGKIDIADIVFSAAALSSKVRYVAMLTETPIDGALTFDIKAMADRPVETPLPMVARKGAILTVGADGKPVSHSQHALMAATVDFISEARIGMRQPVVSTISVASFAGFIAGPLAGFMSGAEAYLHGPFDRQDFCKLLSSTRQSSVVIPAAIAQALIDDGLANGPEIGTLIALTRLETGQRLEETGGPPLQPPRDGSITLIDLFAFGEESLASKRRPGNLPSVVMAPASRPTSRSAPSSLEMRRANAI